MSGGVLSSNPIGASGMLRFAEAAMQVRGMAGEHQVDGARTAVGPRLRRRLAVLRHVGRRLREAVSMGRLEGKVAIVTGAARGQGEAEARRFVAEGAQVLLTDVLDDEGEAVAADLGDAAAYRHLDVTSEEEWVAAVADCRGALRPGDASS